MATLSIADASDPEGPGEFINALTHLHFDVTLTGDVPGGFTVDYTTLDITAQSFYDVNTLAPTDYNDESGATLTFAGTDGETNPIDVPVTVTVLTTDGTATQADHDYAPPPSSVIYDDPNGSFDFFDFDVFKDFKIELDETFDIAITGLGAQGRDVTIDAANATTNVTILNDDHGTINLVVVNSQTGQLLSPATADEDDWANAEFQVRLLNNDYPIWDVGEADVNVIINWQTIDGTAQDEGTGPGSNDYDGGTGTDPLVAGEKRWKLPVSVYADNVVESNEYFEVKIVGINPDERSISLGTSLVSASIQNDDAGVISLSGTLNGILEGDGGFTDVVLDVGLSAPIQGTVQVAFTNTDGSASSAFTSQDYLVLTASPLIFPAGSDQRSIVVRVFGDTSDSDGANEDFTITLTGVTAPAGLSVVLNLGKSRVTDDGLRNISRMKKLLGVDFADAPNITVDAVRHLQPLPNLSLIDGLRNATDGTLEILATIPKLCSLDIADDPQVTDDGLRHLERLKRLQYVHLGPGITDAGMVHIGKIRGLSNVDLRNTRITGKGLRELWASVSGSLFLPSMVGDKGLWHLADFKLPITTLYLEGETYTDEAIPRIANVRGLTVLRLQNTKISENGTKLMKKLKPNVLILFR